MSRLSSNIVKAGALVTDTRRFVEVWDSDQSAGYNLERIEQENLLGLPSRKRIYDTLTYGLRPRYVDPGDEVIPALRELIADNGAFLDACYYETARVDLLLAQFVEGPLFDWHDHGRLTVSTEDVVEWLDKRIANEDLPEWSESLRRRVSQGFLSALRDFGILAGATRSKRKDISPRSLTLRGFVYVAFRLHQQGLSSRGILASNVWRRWLVRESELLELVHAAHGTGALAFESAGSAIRMDWSSHSLLEVVRAAV